MLSLLLIWDVGKDHEPGLLGNAPILNPIRNVFKQTHPFDQYELVGKEKEDE